LVTLDAYIRPTPPAKTEAQGWVMQQLLTEDSKAALAGARPASARTILATHDFVVIVSSRPTLKYQDG
jgi:hypothetical protein